MDENELLINEINKWDGLLKNNIDFIEMAFFKIFVKFENFVIEMIIQYATGTQSSKGYIPERRLKFDDVKHLKDTIDTDYIDLGPKTKKLVAQIFHQNNPFSHFFDSAESDFFEKLRSVRNYIAHESLEAKEKYKRSALFNREFIEPKEYLQGWDRKQRHISRYGKFIELVKNYSEFILYMEE